MGFSNPSSHLNVFDLCITQTKSQSFIDLRINLLMLVDKLFFGFCFGFIILLEVVSKLQLVNKTWNN